MADETGLRRAWLWTFVARRFTVFAVRTSRAATILTDLFDAAYGGVMHCDRAKMYWQLGRLQWCWAHLKRDVETLIDHPDLQLKRLGHDLMRPIQKLFRHWSRCRDGTLTHREMQRLLAPVRREVNALLLRGHGTAAHGMCRELFTHREWLWTFLEVVGWSRRTTRRNGRCAPQSSGASCRSAHRANRAADS
ncbi:MAG: transposase [Planctomycetaceae bacterium]